MTGRLAGRRCLVTGGTRGLGRAIALALAAAGARLAVTYSSDDDDAAETVALLAEVDCRPLVHKGSVADADDVRRTVAAVVGEWGGIDVLVNAAGTVQVLPIALLEEEDWDRVLDTCLKGAYLVTRAVLRHMIRARAGHVLMIGNFATGRVVESPIHYAAAKAGLGGLTEALAREVGRHGIQVNLLAPGILDVGMGTGLPQHRVDDYVRQCPLGRVGRASEVAEAAVFLVSPENSFMSGARVVLDGGV